jgi:hypothetical protein
MEPANPMAWFEKQGSTTHFDVVDAYGNALGCTHSLGSGFGSGVTVPGTGAHTCSGLHSCIVLYCIVVDMPPAPFCLLPLPAHRTTTDCNALSACLCLACVCVYALSYIRIRFNICTTHHTSRYNVAAIVLPTVLYCRRDAQQLYALDGHEPC